VTLASNAISVCSLNGSSGPAQVALTPTLSEWALALLGALVVLAGIAAMRRR